MGQRVLTGIAATFVFLADVPTSVSAEPALDAELRQLPQAEPHGRGGGSSYRALSECKNDPIADLFLPGVLKRPQAGRNLRTAPEGVSGSVGFTADGSRISSYGNVFPTVIALPVSAASCARMTRASS